MELDARNTAKQSSSVMVDVTYVCSIAHAATRLGEDPELLEAIVSNDGIEELRDMLANARVSIKEWHSFLEDFVDKPDIIARVKNQPLR